MRVDVLNGVNLDQLGRRDPEIDGTLTLRELEASVRGSIEVICGTASG